VIDLIIIINVIWSAGETAPLIPLPVPPPMPDSAILPSGGGVILGLFINFNSC
jgi:hypothetical protein